METHFMKLLTNSFCADVASRGSLELHSRFVSLSDLPLCGLPVVAPRRFHFTITAYTDNRAALAGQKFDKLTRWKGGIL
jgi:hypothetical protein